MRKGQETRAAIVNAALEHASRNGLEGLTIGVLAERMQMSKSGVFAHFGSREELQIAVLRAYGERFIATVLKPALLEPRGLARLLAMLGRWIEQTILESDAGCLWISSATEYDDRPGAVRDELVATLTGWQHEVARAITLAIGAGHLSPATDVDDLVFDLHGAILALHHDARLMQNDQAPARARRAVARALAPYIEPAARKLLQERWVDVAAPAVSPSSVLSNPASRGRRHASVHPSAS